MSTAVKEQSTNAENLKLLANICNVNEILKNIGLRWKMQLLSAISDGIQQFSQLKRAHPGLSDQILGKRLGEMVVEELLIKTVLPDSVPTQVIYSITPKGKALLRIVKDLYLWGQQVW